MSATTGSTCPRRPWARRGKPVATPGAAKHLWRPGLPRGKSTLREALSEPEQSTSRRRRREQKQHQHRKAACGHESPHVSRHASIIKQKESVSVCLCLSAAGVPHGTGGAQPTGSRAETRAGALVPLVTSARGTGAFVTTALAVVPLTGQQPANASHCHVVSRRQKTCAYASAATAGGRPAWGH